MEADMAEDIWITFPIWRWQMNRYLEEEYCINEYPHLWWTWLRPTAVKVIKQKEPDPN